MAETPIICVATTEVLKKVRLVPEHVQPSPTEWAEFAVCFKLSPRQLQVAQLLFADCLSKALGHRLGCARSTVSIHRTNLYAKLDITDRSGVVRKILEFCLAGRSGRSQLPPD